MKFDQSLQYQFVLFFSQPADPELRYLKELPSIMSQQVPNTKSLGLKFSQERQPGMAQAAGVAGTMPSFIWGGGTGIWKMTWTPIRLDLTFDAGAFAEIEASVKGESPTVPDLDLVIDRVAPNLGDALEKSTGINRLALIFTGKSSASDGASPTKIVAKRFFNTATIESANTGQVRDLTGRVNWSADWKITTKTGAQESTPVNRIEQATVSWNYDDESEYVSLTWQFDVNTSPAAKRSYGRAGVRDFQKDAAKWIADRLSTLENANG
jgi:hypothetical protein